MPEMEYLIRFSQSHETFRLPEIEALAIVEGIDLKVVSYSLEVSLFKLHSLNRDTSMSGQKQLTHFCFSTHHKLTANSTWTT